MYPDKRADAFLEKGAQEGRAGLYRAISGSFGDVGVGERLEGIYRVLYRLTIEHPVFEPALKKGDGRAVKVKANLDQYGREVEEIKRLIAGNQPYEARLSVLSEKLQGFAEVLEDGYRGFAERMGHMFRDMEEILGESADLQLLMQVGELKEKVEGVKASLSGGMEELKATVGAIGENVETSTERKARDDDIALRLSAVFGRLVELEAGAKKALAEKYALKDEDVEKIRGIVTEALRHVPEVDYDRVKSEVGSMLASALADFAAASVGPQTRTIMDAIREAVSRYPTETRLKELFTEAASGVSVAVTATIDSAAVNKAIGNAVREAIEGKHAVAKVDEKDLADAVRSAVGGLAERIERYIDGRVERSQGEILGALKSAETKTGESEKRILEALGNIGEVQKREPRAEGAEKHGGKARSPRKGAETPEGDSGRTPTARRTEPTEGGEGVDAQKFLDDIFGEGK